MLSLLINFVYCVLIFFGIFFSLMGLFAIILDARTKWNHDIAQKANLRIEED